MLPERTGYRVAHREPVGNVPGNDCAEKVGNLLVCSDGLLTLVGAYTNISPFT